jgi:hypothetical protein
MRKAHKEDAWIKLMCDPNDDSQSQAGPKTGGDVVQAPALVPCSDDEIPASFEDSAG